MLIMARNSYYITLLLLVLLQMVLSMTPHVAYGLVNDQQGPTRQMGFVYDLQLDDHQSLDNDTDMINDLQVYLADKDQLKMANELLPNLANINDKIERSTADTSDNHITQKRSETPPAIGKDNPALKAEELAKIISGVMESNEVVSGIRSSRTSEGSVQGSNWIYIGGLFESSEREGKAALKAAEMAIEHVNKQGIIHGYKLKLEWNNTKCDPGSGADAFYDLMYRKPAILMLLASACSEVTKTLAEIVPYWNLLLISYGSTSPALSKREKYPTFFRLAATEASQNTARIKFLLKHKWNTVASLTQDQEIYTLALDEMVSEFESANITQKATETFRGTGDDLRSKMNDLKATDARIILASFNNRVASNVFCEAYHLSLYGPRFVWMLVGHYDLESWSEGSNCTYKQLQDATQGYFTVRSLNSIIGTQPSVSGLTTDEFITEFSIFSPDSSNTSELAKLSYDSIWTMALTFNKTMDSWRTSGQYERRLSDFRYKTGTDMKNDFMDILGRLEFTGVSGPVSFDGPDRRGISVLEQNQDGHAKPIAFYYPDSTTLDFKCANCQQINWPGGRVPADKYTILIRKRTIEPTAFYIITCISLSGILLALCFLAFNLYNRKLKYIKLSSPQLNNLAVLGCIFVYLAVLCQGFDDSSLRPESYPFMCTGRSFLLAAGFSLAFGAMFAKTFRVHQIMIRTHSGLVKNKLLKDKQLLFLIIALLLVDSIILGLWVTIDPMQRSVTNYTAETSADDLDKLFIPQLARCHSDHLDKWMASFYAYKGLLLLFGVYMAWETRHVKISALNDSQYIGMNIYNVVIISIKVVSLSSLLADQPTLGYVVVSALLMLSVTGMLLLLFLPKIYAILKHDGSPIIASDGLTVEANTRRFPVDERKEKYYRAEVQNTVYKRQLQDLEHEIQRLEKLLAMDTVTREDIAESRRSYSKPSGTFECCDDELTRSRLDATHEDLKGTFSTVCDDTMELSDVLPPEIEDHKRPLNKQDSGFHTMSFKDNKCTYEDLGYRSKSRDEKYTRQRVPNGDVYTRNHGDSDVENDGLLDKECVAQNNRSVFRENFNTSDSEEENSSLLIHNLTSCRHLSSTSVNINLVNQNANSLYHKRASQGKLLTERDNNSHIDDVSANMKDRSSSARSSRVYDADLLNPVSMTQSSRYNSASAIGTSCDRKCVGHVTNLQEELNKMQEELSKYGDLDVEITDV